MTSPAWLSDAVFYQIYPQSFADSDGDGIGDFAGIESRLDHLAWLGVNAVWLNPCFKSPFRDAGYDVADYLTVAPRYGTNDDLAKLVDAAGRRGIRVLLDLVAGHTSDQHPWFTAEAASAADPAEDRYIWAEAAPADLGAGWVPSPGSRPGSYQRNFFDSQPALNFGYARLDPAEPWRLPVDAPGPRANREALFRIMDHWLRLGVSGFRVDMAASLVKDDPEKAETVKLWQELRARLDAEHPEAILLSEWGHPEVSVPGGFHADFFLHFGGPTRGRAMRSLWNNGAGTDDDTWDPIDCFFDAEGKGSPRVFHEAWQAAAAAVGPEHLVLPTSNHDFSRLACGPRTAEQLPAAFAFQLTWPTLPAIYYGDEIGMRYVPGLPDKEGSVLGPRYNRAGSRTPMQWDATPGAGFSTAPPESFYLPPDPAPDRPDVASQRAAEDSLLHQVRRLIELRKSAPELGPLSPVEVIGDTYPFVYVRGDRYLIAVNPRREAAATTVRGWEGAEPVLTSGALLTGTELAVPGFGYGIFSLSRN
ncbi:oligo-1,6-glucosidase [Streptomyces sp. A7024]|uniref:Oligo-1,6-glucosidase n=1 Tax=Streptomyces coryli TaxID=1128680 RepID=A0A6G4U839_9ACTN|nr:alpha-amylase family glycosyl hydrolase [Streptomyces coryli]NGN68405.1 oligo-1,6-glucosidase [Streptomyces coryli]